MSKARAMTVLKEKAGRVLRVRAESLRSEIYGVLEESKVGRGTNVGPKNQRSKPGDAPARQTGRLMESVKVLNFSAQDLTASVGPDPKAFKNRFYASDLEFGTRHTVPRAFMRPALERFKRSLT